MAVGEAAAQVRIDEARLDDNGWLIVRGKVAKRAQLVTLDRKFVTRSGVSGRFQFQVERMPFLCRVEVRAQGVQEVAKVENCVMDDMRRLREPPSFRSYDRP